METTTLQSICEEIRLSLEQKKQMLLAEMRNYPQPVSGCDEQFKYLIAQRDNLYRELDLLESITHPDKSAADVVLLVNKLVQTSAFMGAENLLQIRAELDAVRV